MKVQQKETLLHRFLKALKVWREPHRMHSSHEQIKRGVGSWNNWRQGDPTLFPDLGRVDLTDLDVFGANFRNVNLQKANLTKVKNIQGTNLGGANLSGAELPQDAELFDALSQVDVSIRYNGKTFLLLILGCVYTWLTIATTSDANLLTNTYSSPLPIIGTKVQIGGFYFVAPIILLITYGYLHIQLQRLWERLSNLPAVFADGQSIDKKIAPWFPTGLLYYFLFHLSQKPPPLSKVQAFASLVLVWFLLPAFTLPFVWLKYLSLQSWYMTGVHIAIIIVAIGFGTHSCLLARETLSRNTLDITPPSYWVSIRMSSAVGLILCLLSFGSFQAVHQHFIMGIETQPGNISNSNLPNQFPKASWYQTFAPKILAWVTYSPFPNLENAEVSVKPADWDGKNIENVTGARLKNKLLTYANLADAFLVNADLRNADLQRANLSTVDLRGSILGTTNLAGAYFMNGKLQRADLTSANLRSAYLLETDLREANLRSVSGEMAWLNGANLEGANLRDAKFQCADFGRANMMWIELPDFMWGTDKGHHIAVASLKGAQLSGADLEGVRLEGANLSGATGLTQEQLDKTCVSERTSLPDGLRMPQPCAKPLENVLPEAKKVTSYSTWGIGSLQQAALTLAKLLRNFSDVTDKQLDSLSDTKTKNDDERKKAAEQSSQFMDEQIVAYNKQFRSLAVQLRKEMLSRLNLEEKEPSNAFLFDSPTNPHGMRQVANTLEKLADQLCSVQQKRSKTIGTLPMLTS
ncbi:MAG: pentapeptide repeat-containing protein [Nitrospira sp.]|nr:pentapeptide repeat-containing protein [Nitrospira sp.]